MNFPDRMTSLTDIDGSVFAYEFDGEGNRLSQSLNDCLSKRFVYDGADVLLELNPTNGVAYAWVNGPGIDQPIGKKGTDPEIRHGAGVYSPTVYGSGDRMYASGWGHGRDIKAPDLPRTRPDLALAFLKDAYQLMSGNDPSPATVAELWDLSRGRAKATKDIIPPFQKRQDLEIDEESIKRGWKNYAYA